MSVLLYDPARKTHILELRTGPWANRRWITAIRVCANPCCPCFHLNFQCAPEDPASAPTLHFTLDAEKRSLSPDPASALSRDSRALARSVVAELGEAGWRYLGEFLTGIKQKQIDECNPEQLDVEFDPELLSGRETTVGYRAVFPFAPLPAFSVEDREWIAFDDYCLNPECACREVILQFAPIDTRGRVRYPKDLPAVIYDYGTRTVETLQEPGSGNPSMPTLLDALIHQNEDFHAEAGKRHRVLKTVFKRARAKWIPPPSDSDRVPRPQGAARPGRNDPCTCGSGRKYKKCCGS